MGIFYFILVWRVLESIKLNIYFFLPTSNKFAIQNNPFMQLRLICHKIVNKKKLKAWKFQSYRLSSFSAITKTVTGVEGKRGSVRFVLIIIFVCTHKFPIQIEFLLKSFYCNCQFIFFCCFTHFFSSAIPLFFFFHFPL